MVKARTSKVLCKFFFLTPNKYLYLVQLFCLTKYHNIFSSLEQRDQTSAGIELEKILIYYIGIFIHIFFLSEHITWDDRTFFMSFLHTECNALKSDNEKKIP